MAQHGKAANKPGDNLSSNRKHVVVLSLDHGPALHVSPTILVLSMFSLVYAKNGVYSKTY